MVLLSQLRGYLFEEIVLVLLKKTGYEIIEAGDEGTIPGHAGLEVQGRGERHQIDALCRLNASPPYMYPLRLIVEAKCLKAPVGIEVPRNAVGVFEDITQNYFIDRDKRIEIQVPRYNYHYAIFSASGFSIPAQRYSIAHQIFLLQYKHSSLIRPILDNLFLLNYDHFISTFLTPNHRSLKMKRGEVWNLRSILRNQYSEMDRNPEYIDGRLFQFFNENGMQIMRQLQYGLANIRGSYYGAIMGQYPIHLLSNRELPTDFFSSDEFFCRLKIISNYPDQRESKWYFYPADTEFNNTPFKLEFDLPETIARIVNRRWSSRGLINSKRRFFTYVDMFGIIGGIRRHIRLKLEQDWLLDLMHSIQ